MQETQAWPPQSGRYPGGGNGDPLQCSCLENPTDRGAWWATVHRVAESGTNKHEHRNEWILNKNMYLSIGKCLHMCHPVYSCSP